MTAATTGQARGALWRDALGEAFERLHPSLRAYFSAPPPGARGVGEGVFERVGTPRRWLAPALALAGALGIAWPRWEADVPFRVVNRVVDGALLGERRFGFRSGERAMYDAMRPGPPGTVVDRLGRGGLVAVRLRPRVEDGSMVLVSERATLLGVPLPVRLRIEERALPDGRQRVELTMRAAGIGLAYEYAGEFSYRVEPADAPRGSS